MNGEFVTFQIIEREEIGRIQVFGAHQYELWIPIHKGDDIDQFIAEAKESAPRRGWTHFEIQIGGERKTIEV